MEEAEYKIAFHGGLNKDIKEVLSRLNEKDRNIIAKSIMFTHRDFVGFILNMRDFIRKIVGESNLIERSPKSIIDEIHSCMAANFCKGPYRYMLIEAMEIKTSLSKENQQFIIYSLQEVKRLEKELGYE